MIKKLMPSVFLLVIGLALMSMAYVENKNETKEVDTVKRVSDLEQRLSDLESEVALLQTTPRD